MHSTNKTLIAAIITTSFAGCASTGAVNFQGKDAKQSIVDLAQEMVAPKKVIAVTGAAANVDDEVASKLIEASKPKASASNTQEKLISLDVQDKPVRELLLAIKTKLNLSITIHEAVRGNITISAKNQTLDQILARIEKVADLDIQRDGANLDVMPGNVLVERRFDFDYPDIQRVSSSMTSVGSPNQSAAASGGVANAAGAAAGGSGSNDYVTLLTTQRTDVWARINDGLTKRLGKAEGRSFDIDPGGKITVVGMPSEVRRIGAWLKEEHQSMARQVMIEAKIVSVDLSQANQSGVDWSALKGHNAIAVQSDLNAAGFPSLSSVATPGALGIKLATHNINAALSFLETVGQVNVMSSPRIASLNSQPAFLKDGFERDYITSISSNASISSGGVTTATIPNIVRATRFSGVSLEMAPQINEKGRVMLYVHPIITDVESINETISIAGQTYSYPTPKTTTHKADVVVSLDDDSVVAIGGLMKISDSKSRSGIPGTSEIPVVNQVAGSNASVRTKSEMIILLKATVIRSAEDWQKANEQARQRLIDVNAQPDVVINMTEPSRKAK